MTLADIQFPVDVAWARGHALAFPAALAGRVAEVQAAMGDVRYKLTTVRLADGRHMLHADVLTECVPGGFLYPAFSLLEAGQFNQIAVIPIADAIALMPQPQEP